MSQDAWQITVQAEGDGPRLAVRVRNLLKSALRRYGLRCQSLQRAFEPEPKAPEKPFEGRAEAKTDVCGRKAIKDTAGDFEATERTPGVRNQGTPR